MNINIGTGTPQNFRLFQLSAQHRYQPEEIKEQLNYNISRARFWIALDRNFVEITNETEMNFACKLVSEFHNNIGNLMDDN